jgi:hypothetical protein
VISSYRRILQLALTMKGEPISASPSVEPIRRRTWPPARKLRLTPGIHQGLGGTIRQPQPGGQVQAVRHCGIGERLDVDAATRQ